MFSSLWHQCLTIFESNVPEKQITTWLKPLSLHSEDGLNFYLLAPNRWVKNWVTQHYLTTIEQAMLELHEQMMSVKIVDDLNDAGDVAAEPVPSHIQSARELAEIPGVIINNEAIAQNEPVTITQPLSNPSSISVQQTSQPQVNAMQGASSMPKISSQMDNRRQQTKAPVRTHPSFLETDFTFKSLIEGKSNEIAYAAAQKAAENPGKVYNPLFIYGGVGLGKTHIMHAIGNEILANNPEARIMYLSSERFVREMVSSIRDGAIEEFKSFYRSLDAILIDDIQFFVGKEKSQEELFFIFNALLEGKQQIVLTSDKLAKEIDGIEDRLRSRFGWGLSVPVEPPEVETRQAILQKKAELKHHIHLLDDVAFFLASKIRSNVRDLEGALNKVVADANFTQKPITIETAKESIKDILAMQDKQVSIENIQRVVAEYYKIKISDLHSKSRKRRVTRPRQLAMLLARELTKLSLIDIGDSFGGRDHSTVVNACEKIEELKRSNRDIVEDYNNLLRTLTN
ncbi:chromosomal replication initiator protein DnaA [Marinicellulosiphila megalodicopiae]|uniref:chromosomal replication initiator protein DnaA n=1 Tax=Marinicellulosiphila megalodicopiae TaxID=2724896 RepID=UPI003BAFFA60